MLSFGVVSDMHFGPQAHFGGTLRKLSHLAPQLAAGFAERMRQLEVDFVVNLGDCIEDEDLEQDRSRYLESVRVLAGCGREVVHVAGNHDTVHLQARDLNQAWGRPAQAPLYRSFERGGMRFITLHTQERKDVDVTIDEAQLSWLQAELDACDQPVIVLMHHSAADQDLRQNRWFENAPHLCLVKQRKRLRSLFERHGQVVAVLNGHLHWNHLDIIAGIPYVTLQSLIENVDDDAPGTPAAAHALVRVSPRRIVIEVAGAQPTRYQRQL